MSVLDADCVDTPLVGTPTPAGPQHCRPSPWADQVGNSNHTSSESINRIATPPLALPKQSPKKRAAINPNLGKECPLNILIAEDNAINRNVVIGSLNKLGYSKENITVAFDGREAVKHYEASLSKSSSQRFDIILMDIWMPNMDGYEATANIMELAKMNGERTIIVAVTADITEESVDRAKGAGMQGFLAKPYKVLDIEHLITEHFPRE